MIEHRSSTRFLLEALYSIFILREVFRQQLERNLPAKASVLGQIHFSHSAHAEPPKDAVVGDQLGCGTWFGHAISSFITSTLRTEAGFASDVHPGEPDQEVK